MEIAVLDFIKHVNGKRGLGLNTSKMRWIAMSLSDAGISKVDINNRKVATSFLLELVNKGDAPLKAMALAASTMAIKVCPVCKSIMSEVIIAGRKACYCAKDRVTRPYPVQ